MGVQEKKAVLKELLESGKAKGMQKYTFICYIDG